MGKKRLSAAVYQMPRPMSTMPMASHPRTPTEIIVSRVIWTPKNLNAPVGKKWAGHIAAWEADS